MAKNLIPEVAKMLGVEIGERFKIDCSLDRNIFFFDELGLKVRNGDVKNSKPNNVNTAILEDLLVGRRKIIKK